ncbi:MAG: arginine N-succinyltransferase [Phycisphaerales bacterium JB064]
MHIIRRAKIEDVDTLLKLSKMVHFINLPPDREIITEKILRSRDCFKHVGRGEPLEDEPKGGRGRSGAGEGLKKTLSESELFVFVLEDTETGAVLGSSQLVSAMGGPGNPNVGFKITERRFFSESLHTGMTHTVATLHLDESSPTEIGGLILQPAYRAHKARLGRLLSFVRFHFMGLYRQHFADHVLAEMMAPISDAGDNQFWDALGRRFINLSYDEADRFCQYSREFMFTMLPREDIYLTLLPPKARQGVGQVGKDTVPARKMLEKLGFRYQGVIDPFDGGPHLQAITDDIPLVRTTRTVKLGKAAAPSVCKGLAILSVLDSEGEYLAIQSPLVHRGESVSIPKDAMTLLGASEGDEVAITVIDPMPTLDTHEPEAPKKRAAHKKTSKKSTKTTSKTKTRRKNAG